MFSAGKKIFCSTNFISLLHDCCGHGAYKTGCMHIFFDVFHNFNNSKRYYSHYLLSLISLSIHQSSIILNGLILIPNLGNIKKLIKKIISNNYSILILILILIIIGFSFPSIIYSTFYYFKFYGEKVPKGKGAIFLWLMNFIPSIIFIYKFNKFNFEYSLKKILFHFLFSDFITTFNLL